MKDCAIQETYTIPSKGKLYDFEMNPLITLRSMTTQEEMIRLSHSEYQYKNLADILDACGVAESGMSAYDMCVGDFQFLIYKLRIVTYGTSYDVSSRCPYCGHMMKDTINIDDLPVFEYNDEIEKYREFVLPMSGKKIRLNVQTPRMIDQISERTKEFKKKSTSSFDPTMMFSICAMIDEIDGEHPNITKLEDWVRNLPMLDTNTILSYIEKFTDALGVDIQLQNTCDLCGLDFDTTLRITSEFFRPEIRL